MTVCRNLESIIKILEPCQAKLVAVSKSKPAGLIQQAYDCRQIAFGENYVRELFAKQKNLPQDIEWHFIGHLQSNKVKLIAPFVSMIQSVDSLKLLREINKEAKKNNRVISCLLQVHIAEEETKSGLSYEECKAIVQLPELSEMKNISIKGLMGMATFTDNQQQIRSEFRGLKIFFDSVERLKIPGIKNESLSMGMTSDYRIALEEGSNMVRIGSAIFGERN